jgi:hypothetical protein
MPPSPQESFQKLVKFISNKEAHYPVPEGKYHCVPEGWLGSWIDYLDDPDIEELPEAIPSQSLLCPHDKLKFDPFDPNSSLYLIRDPDWNALRLA